MNDNFIDKPYIITYSNYFKIADKTFAFRKCELFDISEQPKLINKSINNESLGYWINRKWYSFNSIKQLIINEPKLVDVSDLQWYRQIQLDAVFNLKENC